MNNLVILSKLSIKFALKYFEQYLRLILKPVLTGSVGIILVMLTAVNPLFALPALVIGLPVLCYSLWKGYLIVYSLNCAALDFIRGNGTKPLFECLFQTKQKEKELIKYLAFSALASIAGFLPTIVFAVKKISMMGNTFQISEFMSAFGGIVVIALINGLIMLPFLNFYNQAFFFKKDHENFIDLFLNCYKKLNLLGFIIALIITAISAALSALNIYLYAAMSILFNLISFSVNTFWYYSRTEPEKHGGCY